MRAALGKTTPIEIGLGFRLPQQWRKLFATRPLLKRLCVALGFRPPQEESGPSNSNLASLYHVLDEYKAQLDHALETMDELAARRAARDYMQQYEFLGSPLGEPQVPRGKWIYCGLAEGEDELPASHKKAFCGCCFHWECVGRQTTPKAHEERVPCLMCQSDPRYRAKPPPLLRMMDQGLYLHNGVPRITVLNHSEETRIKTLLLVCDCLEQIGSGLPCEGMLGVSRILGGVLSHRHVHPHWFTHKISGVPDPEAVMEANDARMFDAGAVLSQRPDGQQQAASALGDGLPKPQGVRVKKGKSRGGEMVRMAISRSEPGGRQKAKRQREEEEEEEEEGDFDEQEEGVDLGAVIVGGLNADSKKSRRYKANKKGKKD